MFHRARTLISLVILCATPSWTLGDEPPTDLEKQWQEAKTRFAQESEKLKQSVLNYLTTFENKARERGDTAKLKEIESERDAFDQRGELPKNFNRGAYDRNRKSVQDDLKKAQKALLIDYLKQRKDAEAQALEYAFAELIAPTAKTPATDAPKDKQRRWLNTSYDSTLYYVSGKQWAEMDNKTKMVKWNLEERARAGGFIELFLPARNQMYRLSDGRLELKDGSEWKWLSNGYWIDSAGQATKPKR